MKTSITLIPYGGLANRMKAIEALIALTHDTNANGNVIWFKDKGLNCSFSQLFQTIKLSNITVKEAVFSDYLLNDRPREKNLFIPFLFEKWRFNSCLHQDDVTKKTRENFDFLKWALSNDHCYLSACCQFYPSEPTTRFNSFIPITELQERINKRCRNFTTHTVGIHIRRTDNIISTKESPTELFVLRMKKEIEKNKEVRFYLASDSQEEKERLIAIFGDRIFTEKKPTSRDSPEGIQEALVELYALSRTQIILGSHYSSYSETAAEIGKIPYEKIKR